MRTSESLPGDDPMTKAIAGKLAGALLPGDAPFAKAELAEAARFVAAAAASRPGAMPSIAIE